MTLDEAISDLEGSGWIIHQLCQPQDLTRGVWRCYLRQPHAKLISYGQGETYGEALAMAIDGRSEPTPLLTEVRVSTVDFTTLLGLKPKVPFKRRI